MLELEDAAKSFQKEKEYMNALSLTDLFSCNINQCIKELKNNNCHEEKSARRTVSSLGATSKPKTRVANNIKHVRR